MRARFPTRPRTATATAERHGGPAASDPSQRDPLPAQVLPALLPRIAAAAAADGVIDVFTPLGGAALVRPLRRARPCDRGPRPRRRPMTWD